MSATVPTVFDFVSAGQLRFGAGAAADLPALAAGFGSSVLVVTGSDPSRVADVIEPLDPAAVVTVTGEPTVEVIEAAVAEARREPPDVIVGVGGGSVLDAAKAIAGLVPSERPAIDHLEVVGAGLPLDRPALPVIAGPTTSGTGSEVTKNAVLSATEHRQKVSLRHQSMIPRVALVDPALTVSAPRGVTVSSGLDALSQCIEPYTSGQATPITDGLARSGIMHGAAAIRRVAEAPEDLEARTRMSLCSVLGGLSLANAKLGAAHGFAGPLGGSFDAPHGAICGRLLPAVFDVNARALAARAPEDPIRARLDEVAQLLTGRSDATAADGAAWLAELCDDLGVPGLGQFGVGPDDVADLCQRAAGSSSMKGNPIVLTADELAEILERSL